MAKALALNSADKERLRRRALSALWDAGWSLRRWRTAYSEVSDEIWEALSPEERTRAQRLRTELGGKWNGL